MDDCKHKSHEDHMICSGCGRCYETLSDNDLCPSCLDELDTVKWYVRHNGTDEISGPMAESHARNMADAADGVAFSELIFTQPRAEPTEVEKANELVEQVLVDLREDIRGIIAENKSAVPDIPEVASTCQVKNCLLDLHGLASSYGVAPRLKDIALDAIRIIDGLANGIVALQSDPKEAHSAEMRQLVCDMQAVASSAATPPTYYVQRVMRRGIDAIVHLSQLSHPKYVMSGEASQLVAEMQADVSKRWVMAVSQSYLHSRELLRKAIDMIVLISREKVVSGTIQGGSLSLDELPEGVTVDIRDYDTEGGDEHDLQEDEHGHYFPAG